MFEDQKWQCGTTNSLSDKMKALLEKDDYNTVLKVNEAYRLDKEGTLKLIKEHDIDFPPTFSVIQTNKCNDPKKEKKCMKTGNNSSGNCNGQQC